ncbi:homeobox protein ceh-30-like isoform X1 [Lethenteron reissneri]|uniref:homeobox protein ceh-30-like isoform X1 n=1 Tax=Lethenteron reissneri TaxID=7753 RepID=UPI002AB6FDC9|nr:homeobox protein ceh-30-like isoform X1 [Lethenteron reissneri]
MTKSMFSSVEWLAGLSCGEMETTVAGELSSSASFLSSPSPSSSYYSLSSSSSPSTFFISSQSSLDEQRRAGSTSPDCRPNSCPSSPAGSQHSSRSSSPAPCSSSSGSSPAAAAATSGGVTDEEEEVEEEGDAPRHGPRRAAGFCRRARTAFSSAQLAELESSFRRRRYLSVAERGELGRQLGMSDLQVKTWFQNRRMKQKREELGARGGGAFPHVPPLFPLAPPLASWLTPLGALAPPLSAPPAFSAPPCCPYLLLY